MEKQSDSEHIALLIKKNNINMILTIDRTVYEKLVKEGQNVAVLQPILQHDF